MTQTTLASWNKGQARDAILNYVERVTSDGPGFIPAADRVAAFDNDGTLWVEQPVPPQLDFVFGTWAEEVRQDPALASRQPYKALIEKDPAFLQEVATQDPDAIKALLEAFSRSWAGVTAGDFDAEVRHWLTTVRQERFGVSYLDLVYQPMLELFDLLREHQFRVFVCSGGGRDFMRVFAEQTWGILKENVIGSAAEYIYADGQITRGEQVLGGLDIGPGKPEHIFAQTGRLPLLAGGNADVDIEMLTAADFALLVSHDDAEREYAYTAGAEASAGKARELGWTVVSMKDDWSTVYWTRGTMPDPTAVDILIEPDEAAIGRAREINQRMLRSVPGGFVLDATHEPHITMLQRYLVRADSDRAYAAIGQVIDRTDAGSLAYHVPGITYSEHWGPPGQAAAVLGVEPSQQVVDLQADLVAAVTPFAGSGGAAAAFVTDAGEEISPTTLDWVETYVPDQTGSRYTAHLTVGVATVQDLKAMQAEPFDAFDVRPAGLAVYHLGNNGRARKLLKSWPLEPS